MKFRELSITLSFSKKHIDNIYMFVEQNVYIILAFALSVLSIIFYLIYYANGLGLAYNDSRSHLDIGRRVVEGLKPGLAQLGSVWLPLPHALMIPTVWNDFMWHSGLSGALQSMISYVATGLLIFAFLRRFSVPLIPSVFAVFLFATNMNILYLQSTAMTELLLIATMTAGVYMLTVWFQTGRTIDLILCSFFIMLSTLVRYDGWFLLIVSSVILFLIIYKSRGWKAAEGTAIFFLTLGGFGIALWFLWNQLIFKDAFYFIFGPYSAREQQAQLEQAGVLMTKGNLLLSLQIYFYALAYNSIVFPLFLAFVGAAVFVCDKTIKPALRIVSLALFAPAAFNILALYLGHSVLFIQGISGNTWFNVRYGVMLIPAVAIFIGYLIYKLRPLGYVFAGLLIMTSVISFTSQDAVTIDDARVGSSQKNVSEVAGWLNTYAKDEKGFILISAASHDAIIFSSGLPMKRFIHEGTGAYWELATAYPDRWARYIIMRTNDVNDSVFKTAGKTSALRKYDLVEKYPFADIYELHKEYLSQLTTEPVLGKQK